MVLPLYMVKAIVGEEARKPPYNAMDAKQWKDLAETVCTEWCDPPKGLRGVKLQDENPTHQQIILDEILSTAVSALSAEQIPVIVQQVYKNSRLEALSKNK